MLGLVKLVCSRQSLRLSTKTFSVRVVSLRHAGTPYRKVRVGADSVHVSFRFLASPKPLRLGTVALADWGECGLRAQGGLVGEVNSQVGNPRECPYHVGRWLVCHTRCYCHHRSEFRCYSTPV